MTSFPSSCGFKCLDSMRDGCVLSKTMIESLDRWQPELRATKVWLSGSFPRCCLGHGLEIGF